MKQYNLFETDSNICPHCRENEGSRNIDFSQSLHSLINPKQVISSYKIVESCYLCGHIINTRFMTRIKNHDNDKRRL